jgi:hypothetical protein
MEATEPQALPGQALCRRSLARAAERARTPEAGIVDQDDQDVRRARGRTQRLDRRELRHRILGVLEDGPVVRAIGDRQHFTIDAGGLGHG